ncbi:MAG: glutaredoxin family protein, partial [Candidatus Heimdallarchaeaceae archaeon]
PGKKDNQEICLFTLSTCQWCKKGRQWLQMNGYAFSYVDIDLIPIKEKVGFKRKITEKFKPDYLAFPIIVVDGKKIEVGFDKQKWEKLLSQEERK